MKTKPLGLALFLTAILSAVLFSSCRKEAGTVENRAVTAGTMKLGTPNVLSGTLGTGHTIRDTIRLSNAFTWHLSGLVYLDAEDVLVIQPGTLIVGDVSTTTGTPGGGLIVSKNAKIFAEGTVASPIIFTSERYNTNPVPGDWAGIILLGNAPTNAPATTRVEGISPAYPNDVTYGGTNHLDNSGVMKYVRIEYAGWEESLDNEINGLTMAGVGAGTTIDYVEVFKPLDDAFEWFGGNVNASHLVAVDARDDLFDTDRGYMGSISFALGLTDTTRSDHSRSNGIEDDNDPFSSSSVPVTHPKFNYLTIIGLPTAAIAASLRTLPSGLTGRYGAGAHLRRNSEFEIKNSIFLGYTNGILIDSTPGIPGTYYKFLNGISFLQNTFVHGFVNAYAKQTGSTVIKITPPPPGNNLGYETPNPNANIQLVAPFIRIQPSNYVPLSLSAARNAGAFPLGNTTWANGWTRLR
ncbi:hypothetical protein [Chitinophaga solisilvae]|uniref:hypothetical protein n=1 Tax=Chitinophaga solisilvae TaxID=1233460 RepID=UPI00136D6B97|nr:hypothetical protein [Chitinophaga solisilvae]